MRDDIYTNVNFFCSFTSPPSTTFCFIHLSNLPLFIIVICLARFSPIFVLDAPDFYDSFQLLLVVGETYQSQVGSQIWPRLSGSLYISIVSNLIYIVYFYNIYWVEFYISIDFENLL